MWCIFLGIMGILWYGGGIDSQIKDERYSAFTTEVWGPLREEIGLIRRFNMKIRQMQRGGGAELPRAGKKRSLHSSAGGVKLPVKKENSYDAPTQDYSHSFGWKHFDKK